MTWQQGYVIVASMKARTTLVLLSVLAVMAPASAWAWGANAHRTISKIAVESLPEEIPAFLRAPESAWQTAELGREADRSKGAGQPHDHDLDPGHHVYVWDDGTVGGVPLNPLPATREDYDTALRAKGWTEYKLGFLPYSIIDGWQQLWMDFAYWRVDVAAERSAETAEDGAWFAKDRQLRELLIIRDVGYWSHFVADASMPLHVSIHFNGWGSFPNPEGYTISDKVHGYFEGEFVRKHVAEQDVRGKVKPYHDCRCTIQERTVAYLMTTTAQVIPLYELHKAGAFSGDDPKGKEFAAERMAAAASELRDMIIDAWRTSADAAVGYPKVMVRDVEAGTVIPIAELKGRD
jgi:hypothetical protein